MMSSVPSQEVAVTGQRLTAEAAGQQLTIHLRKTAQLIKILDIVITLVACMVVLMAVWLLGSMIDHWVLALPVALRWLIWLACVALLVWAIFVRLVPLILRRVNLVFAANRIEQMMPEFKNGLITWLELQSLPELGVPKGVQAALSYRALRFLGGQDPASTVDSGPLIKLVGASILLVLALALYAVISPKSLLESGKRMAMPWLKISAPTRVQITHVAPGNVELTHGTPLLVEVDLRGLSSTDSVVVHIDSLDGQIVDQRVTLKATVEGLRYVASVATGEHGVEHEILYRIEAGDAVSDSYKVSLSPLPALAVKRVEVQYPAYTRQPPREFAPTAQVDALEGSVMRIWGASNQRLERARLVINPELDDRGSVIRASEYIDLRAKELEIEGTVKLVDTHQAFCLRGQNARGHSNVHPVVHSLNVFKDVPPEVVLVGPESRVVRASPNSRLMLEIRASDVDYGLKTVQLDLSPTHQPKLSKVVFEVGDDSSSPVHSKVVTVPLNLTSLKLNTGDRVELIAIASDTRHDPVTGRYSPNQSKSSPLVLEIVAPSQQDIPEEMQGQPSSHQQLQEQQNQEDQKPVKSSDENSEQEDSAESGTSGSQGQASSEVKQSSEQKQGSQSGQQRSESGKQGSESSKQGSESSKQGSTQGSQNSENKLQSSSGSQETPNQGNSASGSQSGSQKPSNASGQPNSSQPNGNQQGNNPHRSPVQSSNSSGASQESLQQQAADQATMEKIRDYMNRQANQSDQSDQAGQSDQSPVENRDRKEATEKQQGKQPNQQIKNSQPGLPSKVNSDNQQNDQQQDRQQENQQTDQQGGQGANQQDRNSDSGSQSQNPATGSQDGQRLQQQEGQSEDDQSKAASHSGSDGQSGQNGSQQNTKSRSSSEPKSDPDRKSQTGSQSRNQTDSQSESQAGSQSESQSSSQSESQSSSQSKSQSGSKSGNQSSSRSGSQSSSKSGSQTGSQSGSQAGSEESNEQSTDSNSGSRAAGGTAASGSRESGPGQATEGETGSPTDPQFAEQSTDLTLDYLKRQREQPDPDLLRELNWTQDDFRKFVDRYQSARNLSAKAQQVADEPGEFNKLDIGTANESGVGPSGIKDDFRKQLDAGGRVRPPEKLRKQIEAFQKALQRSQSR